MKFNLFFLSFFSFFSQNKIALADNKTILQTYLQQIFHIIKRKFNTMRSFKMSSMSTYVACWCQQYYAILSYFSFFIFFLSFSLLCWYGLLCVLWWRITVITYNGRKTSRIFFLYEYVYVSCVQEIFGTFVIRFYFWMDILSLFNLLNFMQTECLRAFDD